MFRRPFLIYALLLIAIMACHSATENIEIKWPETHYINKPWTRWWWQGSAVNKEDITRELESLKAAGFGGVEITPIYGVAGHEDEFIRYLSDEWMEVFIHTLKEADRLGLGVDMATGTGWPFGGQWVDRQNACKYFAYKTYDVAGGTTFSDSVKYRQTPFVRAVGNQIYEMHGLYKIDNQPAEGTVKSPLLNKRKTPITIDQLKQPVSANENLQLLALDQVRFANDLPLVALMAYSDKGKIIELTDSVKEGYLNWSAPDGKWTLYAIFQGDHGKMVERAAPGGEGNVIDHFSKEAIQQYLARFDSAFEGDDIHTLRAFFNDSYEVDDARGVADWTPGFFEEFEKRRGYDLKEFLPILMERDTGEISGRILCDYRETISELLYDNFTNNWKNWAHGHDAIIRNQAHGSPANILDLYALSDIPETEGTDPLAIKMASSASNVSGKKLTSSESATWLNEHFQSNLADIKINIDNYLLNGVNHIFYHGTAYSPDDEEWPGWLFYAAVHVNDRNPLWHDMPKLNEYIARCQSFLQQRRTYNDVLLYYPIYDKFSSPGREMIEHFDGKKEQFEGTVFQRAANELLTRGYAFDFISDRQIQKLAVEDKAIFSAGNPYKTIIIARSEYIPLPTFDKLMELARSGAKIMFLEGFPEHTSGYEGFQKNEEMFKKAKKQFPFSFSGKAEKQEYEDGEVLTGSELGELLDEAGVKRESLVDNGIRYIRKKAGDKVIYLLNNSSENKFSGWIPLVAGTNDIILYDPMSGKIGKGAIKTTSSDTQVYLEMSPQQTLILECYDKKVNFEPFEFYQPKDTIALNGSWRLTFQDGGLDEPLFVAMDTLKSWTDLPIHKLKAFSGTATYKYEFENPDLNADQLMLDLGTVKESAAVKLNGKEIGTLIGTVFEIEFSSDLLVEGENVLEIEVTNLMANRIADLDKRNIFWKKFYNVNFPAKLREDRGPGGLFTAKNWDPKASGILGPVRLVVLAKRKIE